MIASPYVFLKEIQNQMHIKKNLKITHLDDCAALAKVCDLSVLSSLEMWQVMRQ